MYYPSKGAPSAGLTRLAITCGLESTTAMLLSPHEDCNLSKCLGAWHMLSHLILVMHLLEDLNMPHVSGDI